MGIVLDKIIAWVGATKSMEAWAKSSVSMQEMTHRSALDPDSLRALAAANGQVRRCANLNAGVAASCTPRLFRRRSPYGKSLRGKSVSLRDTAYLRGHTANPISTKAIDTLSGHDLVEIVDGPELSLLRTPNPFYTGSEFRFEKFYYKQICGDYWAHAVTDLDGGFALMPMLPQYVSVEVGSNGFPSNIRYGKPGSSATTSGINYAPDECVSWRFRPSGTSFYRGEGWLADAYCEAGLLEKALIAMSASWDNMQRPDWALLLDESATAESVKDAREAIRNRHSGPMRTMRPLVARAVDIKTMSFSPKDAMFDSQIDRMNRAIRNAAGVPEALQDMNGATFDNAAASVTTHRRDTIYPMLNVDAEQDTSGLLPLLGLDPESYVVAYIDVVPDNQPATQARATAMAQTGSATLNEIRAVLGLPSEPWGDDPPTPKQPAFGSFGRFGGVPNATDDGAEQHDEPSKAISVPFRYAGTCGDVCRKSTPNPLTERGIQAFADSLELWYRRSGETATVDAHGHVTLGSSAARNLAEMLADPLSGVSDAAISRAMNNPPTPSANMGAIRADRIGMFVDEYRVVLAREITANTQDELTAAVRAAVLDGMSLADATAEARRILPDEAGWRALRIANTETSSVNMLTDLEVWKQVGVTHKQWVLSPGACQICQAFYAEYAAEAVLVDHIYVGAGVDIVGSDGTSYTTWRGVAGYPLHPNCRCDQIAVGGG